MPTSIKPAATVFPTISLPIQAMLFLAMGGLIYLLGRNQLPNLAPIWLSAPSLPGNLRSFIPESITWHLPSFFHTYALMLATAGCCSERRLQRWTLGGSLALALALECVQHPAIAAALSQAYSASLTHLLPPSLLIYATTGTFDPGDVAAIALAGVLALAHITMWSHRVPSPARSI